VSDSRDSVTEVAEESFVRERPLEIERGAVLAGRYQVEEVIGKGGSGVVLRVFDRTVQNVVALKVLKSELARDAKWDKRFSRELRLGRPIQHPNVCRIFDIGEADGHRFLTMELATGGSLRDELKRQPALERPIEDRLRDARAAIEGLAAIHGSGVVHRDFKPDNLLRMEDGRLVISDFGLATDAASAPGVTVMIGTPHYMAPEVLAGEPATTRSDVWALGVVLHEIFFGRRPERKATSFDGSECASIRPATSLERVLLALCETCLSDPAAERPADAREVAALFSEVTRRARSPVVHRRWRPWLLAASMALAAVGGGIWTRIKHARAPARSVTTKVQPKVVGVAQDWSRVASVVTRVPGRIHCLIDLDDSSIRIVWGQPRQVVDLNLDSGRMQRPELLPAAYRISCPDRSPKTGQLIYSARNSVGAMEVRLSNRSDGGEAVPVTSGRDPRWLGPYPSFFYSVDEIHPAIFSLVTMQLGLLAGGEADRTRRIGQEAVSPSGDLIAVTGYDQRADAWVELFRRQDEARVGEFRVPLGSRISFGWRDSDLFVAGPSFGAELSVALLDLETGQLRRVGRVPGADLTRISRVGSHLAFVTSERSRDAWSYQHGTRERLTRDGNVAFATIGPSGELLLTKATTTGTFNIWIRRLDGTEERLTGGSRDTTPFLAADGRSWAYADYATGRICLCEWKGTCRTLVVDPHLPGFPSISPEGRRVAFLTQTGRAKMKVVDLQGRPLVEWDAVPVCGGVWSSDNRLWSVENVQGLYYWAEHDARTGEATGRRTRFATDNLTDSSMVDCRAQNAAPGSVLFRPVQAEEDERSAVWAGSRDQLGL